MRDVNDQEVSRQVLKTNEFGSVSGEFVLPQGSLTGYFRITTHNGNAGFRVEEYKRPAFEVTFDKIETTYKFGEEITLTGKAESYSGVKLQNAHVSYRITRQQSWCGGGAGRRNISPKGSVKTDENGKFTVVSSTESRGSSSSRSIYTFDCGSDGYRCKRLKHRLELIPLRWAIFR